MTAQDRTGRPDIAARPRRAPAAVTLFASLAIAGVPVVAASWPAQSVVLVQAAAPTPAPSDPANVSFRVVPVPTPPPTQQPPTPEPATPEPPTPEPTPPGGDLPVTGTAPAPGWLPGLGALLVLGGGLALLAVRKAPRLSRRR